MKKIICMLLTVLMLLSLAGCAEEAVLPPVRKTEKLLGMHPDKLTFEEALAEADVVARVRVGDWIGENTEIFQTYFEAEVLECLKGEAPKNITLIQDGSSAGTYYRYPLFTSGNELFVFLDEARDLPEYESPYWSIGAMLTVMFVSYDADGNRYYMGVRDSVGESMGIEKNYSGDLETFNVLFESLCEIDPFIDGHYSFPYTFAEADVLAAIQKADK